MDSLYLVIKNKLVAKELVYKKEENPIKLMMGFFISPLLCYINTAKTTLILFHYNDTHT